MLTNIDLQHQIRYPEMANEALEAGAEPFRVHARR